MILIDLYTNEGVVGHSYLEPYLKQSMRYIVPAIEDLAAAATGQPVAPFDGYRRGIGSLHLVGREGVSLIAVSGLDMAAWDALAKAAGMPLAVYLGGTVGPVPAYNSNGLWLTPLDHAGGGGGSAGRRRRIHRAQAPAGTREAGRRSGRDRRRARGRRRRRQADVRFQPGPVAGRRAGAMPRARRPGPLLVRGADHLRQHPGLRAARARAEERRSSSARTSTARACCIRRCSPARATTSCRT